MGVHRLEGPNDIKTLPEREARRCRYYSSKICSKQGKSEKKKKKVKFESQSLVPNIKEE